MSVPDAIELLPCPFCGSEARAYFRDNRPVTFCQNEVDHWVDCTSDTCLAHQGFAETAEQAARLWNTRSQTLKPCPTPWCGSTDIYVQPFAGGLCRIECRRCGTRTDICGNGNAARRQWNTRKSDTRRMAETGTGSGRRPGSAVPKAFAQTQSGDNPMTKQDVLSSLRNPKHRINSMVDRSMTDVVERVRWAVWNAVEDMHGEIRTGEQSDVIADAALVVAEAYQDLRTVEFRLALSRITEACPPDTEAGRIAAEALSKHPNRFSQSQAQGKGK